MEVQISKKEPKQVSKKDVKQILGGFSTPKGIVYNNPTCGNSCDRQRNG